MNNLITRLKSGDQVALEEFIREYQGWIYHKCLRKLNCIEDAEEVTQDILANMLERIQHYDESKSLFNWLTSLVFNACIDKFRRRSKLNIVPLYHLRPGDPDPLDQFAEYEDDRVDLYEAVRHHLNDLSARHRKIIYQYYWQDLTNEAIGKGLGLSGTTIKTGHYRAKEILKAKYSELIE